MTTYGYVHESDDKLPSSLPSCCENPKGRRYLIYGRFSFLALCDQCYEMDLHEGHPRRRIVESWHRRGWHTLLEWEAEWSGKQ